MIDPDGRAEEDSEHLATPSNENQINLIVHFLRCIVRIIELQETRCGGKFFFRMATFKVKNSIKLMGFAIYEKTLYKQLEESEQGGR